MHVMIVNNKSVLAVGGTATYVRPKVLLIDEAEVVPSDTFYGGMYTPFSLFEKSLH